MKFNANLIADLTTVTRLISIYASRKVMGLSAQDDYHYFACGHSFFSQDSIEFQELNDSDFYGKYVIQNNLGKDERALLALTLLPDFDRLSFLLMSNFKHNSILDKAPELGLAFDSNKNIYLPTVQTWIWILSKFDTNKQFKLIGELGSYHTVANQLVVFEKNPNAPFTTQRLIIDNYNAMAFLANIETNLLKPKVTLLNEDSVVNN